MAAANIDETTKAGRRTLSGSAAIPSEKAGACAIPCDETGRPIGTPH
ncbi:MAG: hypothetical protein LBB79_00565 [Prevotellaceae bacterium]|nr:hypothetical protein [Prevotellaceae bacterium]